jgi:hypothetical protein
MKLSKIRLLIFVYPTFLFSMNLTPEQINLVASVQPNIVVLDTSFETLVMCSFHTNGKQNKSLKNDKARQLPPGSHYCSSIFPFYIFRFFHPELSQPNLSQKQSHKHFLQNLYDIPCRAQHLRIALQLFSCSQAFALAEDLKV